MRKIKLDLDALNVVSFDTQNRAGGASGSVHANVQVPPTEQTYTCQTAGPSCYVTQCPDPFYSCGAYSCDCTSPTIGPVICH